MTCSHCGRRTADVRADQAATHWTPEEPDQPACGADVDAPPDAVMWGTLNPDKVTCRLCRELAEMPP